MKGFVFKLVLLLVVINCIIQLVTTKELIHAAISLVLALAITLLAKVYKGREGAK